MLIQLYVINGIDSYTQDFLDPIHAFKEQKRLRQLGILSIYKQTIL